MHGPQNVKWVGWSGVRIPADSRDFFLLQNHPDQLCGPSSILVVKWPGSEIDRARPASVKVKNEWSYTSAPPIHFYGMGRDNFTFL